MKTKLSDRPIPNPPLWLFFAVVGAGLFFGTYLVDIDAIAKVIGFWLFGLAVIPKILKRFFHWMDRNSADKEWAQPVCKYWKGFLAD